MARKKMDAEVVSAICEALVHICNDPDTISGICSNWDSELEHIDDYRYRTADDWFDETVRKWPHFSGSISYPIWNRQDMSAPSDQYAHAFACGTLWDNSTEYGRLRWELLAFLLEEASKLEVK